MMRKKISSNKTSINAAYLFYLSKLILFALVYLITARYGLTLDPVNKFATLVWLPSGISISLLLLFGSRLWPGIMLGAFLANLLNGAPLFVALGIGMGNTLEALCCVYLLKRKSFKNSFNRTRDVYLFIFTAVPISASVSATIGVTSLVLGGVINIASYYMTWIAWVMGDAISMLILVPFILTWKSIPMIGLSPKE